MSPTTGKGAALLAGLVLTVYANALDGTFHYDDIHSVVRNPHLLEPRNLTRFFRDPTLFSADADKAMYRPLVLVSYVLNRAAGGTGPRGFLAVNLLLHLGCVLLLWRVARQLGWGGERGALTAAALFAVHPVVSEPVNYVSSRSESLAAVLVLASLLAYVGAGSRGRPWRWGSVALFGGSLLAKATGLALLPVLVAYETILRPGSGPGQKARRLLPFALVATGYAALLAAAGLLPGGDHAPVRGAVAQAATQAKAAGYYLHLLAMPVAQSVDPPFVEGTPAQAAAWAGASLLATWVLLAVTAARGRARFWLLVPLLLVLPASAVPLNVLVNEHRLYAAVAALAVPLAACRVRALGWRRPTLALIVVWGVLTTARNAVWASELSLWRDAVAVGPGQARARVHFGNALRRAGDLAAARQQFQAAVGAEPANVAARTNLANAFYEAARAAGNDSAGLVRAARHYRQVLDTEPRNREALTNLGNVQLALGDTGAAAASYRRAAAAHPNYADAHANLAMLAMRAGDPATAARLLRRVVELEPNEATGHRELGTALALQGDLAGARAAYERACSLDAMDAGACYDLAEVSQALAQRAAAAGREAAAAELRRRAEEVYGDLVARFGDYRRARERLAELRRGRADGARR